ncbi:MAG: hypothetical protein IT215_02335 [Chitinophagaceae bacterium]|nr:hypothetical protein [Chitinophagaceae bacterium]
MATTKYIAGKCNIGSAEIKRKRNETLVSLALTILTIIILFNSETERIWRLVAFIPSTFFGIYIQQWLLKFNIWLGVKGVCNFGERGQREVISSDEDKKKDFVKAWQLYYSAFFLGMGITSLIYYW